MNSHQLFLSSSVKDPWCGRGKAPLPAAFPWCLTWLAGGVNFPGMGRTCGIPRHQGSSTLELPLGPSRQETTYSGPSSAPCPRSETSTGELGLLWQGDPATCTHCFPVKHTAFLMSSLTSSQVCVEVSLLLKGFLLFNHQSHIDVVTATLGAEDIISFGGKTEYRADFISSSLTSKFVFEHRWNIGKCRY